MFTHEVISVLQGNVSQNVYIVLHKKLSEEFMFGLVKNREGNRSLIKEEHSDQLL